MNWISVKDRLPDEEDAYLCCIDSLAFPGTQYIRILKFYGDGTWGHGGNVTHWMPLPEPPKADKTCKQLTNAFGVKENATVRELFDAIEQLNRSVEPKEDERSV